MVELTSVTFGLLIGAAFFTVLCSSIALIGAVYCTATIWAWQKKETQIIPIPTQKTNGLEKLEEMLMQQTQQNDAALKNAGFETDYEDLV